MNDADAERPPAGPSIASATATPRQAERHGRATFLPLLLLAPVVHWLALGPTVPEGTFLQIARLGSSAVADDPSNLVYAFARAPLAPALAWLFTSPSAFLIGGWLGHGLFYLAVYALALAACRAAPAGRVPPERIAAVFTLTLFPLAWALRCAHAGTALVPHDAFHTFSLRTLAATAIALGYLQLVRGRWRTAGWWLAASGLLHPTMGLLGFGLFGSAAAIAAWRDRDNRSLAHVVAAGIATAAPAIWKQVGADWPAALTATMPLQAWYSQMIKDEADDFSIVYNFVVQPATVLYYFALVAGALWLAARLVPRVRSSVSFRLAIVVPGLFLLGAAIELLAAGPGPAILVRPIVSLTPGYRLLSFAFYPLVWLAAILVATALARSGDARAPGTRARVPIGAAVVALLWSALLVFGVVSGRAAASLRYARWAFAAQEVGGLDTYLAAAARAGAPELHVPPLYRCDSEIVTYPGERMLPRIRAFDRNQPPCVEDRDALRALDAESFAGFADQLRALPSGTGLFVPPYLRDFRDALPDHRVFFQEHHDGNLMMGAPRFAAFWAARMRDLLGFDYEGMPSKMSGLSFTRLRQGYLALDAEHLAELRQRYPPYRYLVTEADHVLPYRVVADGAGLLAYDLDSAAAPAVPAP